MACANSTWASVKCTLKVSGHIMRCSALVLNVQHDVSVDVRKSSFPFSSLLTSASAAVREGVMNRKSSIRRISRDCSLGALLSEPFPATPAAATRPLFALWPPLWSKLLLCPGGRHDPPFVEEAGGWWASCSGRVLSTGGERSAGICVRRCLFSC